MQAELRKRILVVDDEQFIRLFCAEVLTQAGFVVDTSHDGIDALELLSANSYDLIIADIEMPRLGGLYLFARSKKEHPELGDRFLFISGRKPAHVEVKRFLGKPFKKRQLLENVMSAFD